jgi:hypothetical protein
LEKGVRSLVLKFPKKINGARFVFVTTGSHWGLLVATGRSRRNMATRGASLIQLLGEAAIIASGKNCREQGLLKVLGERQIALNLGNQPRTLQSRDYEVGYIANFKILGKLTCLHRGL